MNDLYEIKKEVAGDVLRETRNPDRGAIPMKCANPAVDDARKVVKYAKIFIFCRCCFPLALIVGIAFGALAVALNYVSLDGYMPEVIKEILLCVSVGACAGIFVGCIISAIICSAKTRAEKKRFKRFVQVRQALNSTRLILVESGVKVKDNPAIYFYSSGSKHNDGTLFLTMSSLEYYDKVFLTPHHNFLIKLTDIEYAKTKGRDKVLVETAKGTYVFKVPAGKAKFWKKEINHASQYGYYAPNVTEG